VTVRRFGVYVGVLLAGAALLVGCGASQTISTTVVPGAAASVGQLDVRNAFMLGPKPGGTVPAGSQVPLFLTLVNGGHQPDTLTGVRAPGTASSVSITGDRIDVPPGRITLNSPRPRIMLHGLARALHGGESATVTLEFAQAGTVTLAVLVMNRTGPYATYLPTPSGSGRTPSADSTPTTGPIPGTRTSTVHAPTPSKPPMG